MKIDWKQPIEYFREEEWFPCRVKEETDSTITCEILFRDKLWKNDVRPDTRVFMKRWPPHSIRNVPGKNINGQKGEQLKREGMRAAAEAKDTSLRAARNVAYEIAKKRGWVTADDVAHMQLGPAAGSLFRDQRFEWNGEWKKSEQVKNHRRLLRVWVPAR